MCKYLEFVGPHLAVVCHVAKQMLWQLGKRRYLCLFSLWLKRKMYFFFHLHNVPGAQFQFNL